MDADFYRRQADQERRRLSSHQDKQTRATTAIDKATSAAEKADQDAAKASSSSSAKGHRSKAERERKKAASARSDLSKATKAVGASTEKINKYERQARDAQDKADRKARQKTEQERKQQERDAARREREERRREEQVAAQVEDLDQRTGQLESRLAAARRSAPDRITVLLVAGTIVTDDHDDQPLRLDREIREISQKLRASTYRDQVVFETAQATQIADLIDLLNRHDPDIVHFSGHGDQSSLLLEGADGQPQALRGEQVALILQAARKPIRLVLFNACLSADQAEAATEHVHTAIGMDHAILDESAKLFAGQFYASLAEGNSLQSAFDQAHIQAQVVNDDPDVELPVLFAAPGVDPQTLVLVAPPD